MKTHLTSYLILAALLLTLVPAIQAEDGQNPAVIYQTTFSTDPKWQTNNPTTNYWDANLGMYHFSIEPSTGMYAYIPVKYERGSFRLEYDVILNRIDNDATFRLGFSGSEMDPSKGPNVLSQFTNAKFGQIMWLKLVTNGNKLQQVNSQKGDTLSSGPKDFYDGPTVKYEVNKTYHVVLDYDFPNKLVSMKVNEKAPGKDLWGYYVNVAEDLHGMDRIYIGSKGDYGMTSVYAQGYLDNVRLTVPASDVPTPTAEPTFVSTTETTLPTPKPPTTKPVITDTPSSAQPTPAPLPALVPLAALAVAACIGALYSGRRN